MAGKRIDAVAYLRTSSAANVRRSRRLPRRTDHLQHTVRYTKLAPDRFKIIARLADGDVSRLPVLATDLVNNRVDAIVAAAPPAVQAAAGATRTVPVIALDLESDPIASGFVRSLARPGGNVTGVFLDFPDFSAKCLQLLIESVPTLSGVGVLWDPTTGALQLKAVEAAAQGFGIVVQVFEAQRAADIAEAFYVADRSRIQGLLLLSSPLVAGNPQLIADLAIRRNVPTISLFPEIAQRAGCSAMGQRSRTFFVRWEEWRARFCLAQKWPSCRRNAPHDSNWSSISKPPRPSVSKCHRRCSPAPTR